MVAPVPAGVSPRSRLLYLDALRVVAILGVIAIHNWSLLHVLEPGTAVWWLDAAFFTVGRWAVPVFVMISGALLLSPTAEEGAAAFYRRRLRRVGLPAVVWIAAYFVFRATILDQELTRRSIVTDIVNATPFTHLYFVYVIIGLYLATPLLRHIVMTSHRRTVLAGAGTLLAAWAADALLPYLVGSGTRVTGLTYWLPFLGYYLAGSALAGWRIERRWVWTLLVIAVLTIATQVVATTLLAAATDGRWTNWPLSYWSPFTILAAIAIFVAAARDSPGQHASDRVAGAIQTLADATFGVFLLHEMVLYVHAINFVEGPVEQLVLARVPTYLVAVVVSFALVLLVRRIPYLRAVV